MTVKRVLVTGASRGIGHAIVDQLEGPDAEMYWELAVIDQPPVSHSNRSSSTTHAAVSSVSLAVPWRAYSPTLPASNA